MEFVLQFIGNGGFCWAFRINRSQIGLEGVDLIRQETEVSELTLKKIQGHISEINRNPYINLDEKDVRDSGHYKNTNEFTVFTKNGFLNQFCEKVVRFEKSNTSGKIKKAWIERKLNENKVIEAWAEAGYPEYWECEEPEKTNS